MKFSKKYVLTSLLDEKASQLPLTTSSYDPFEDQNVRQTKQLNRDIQNNLADDTTSMYTQMVRHSQLMNKYLASLKQAEQPTKDLIEKLTRPTPPSLIQNNTEAQAEQRGTKRSLAFSQHPNEEQVKKLIELMEKKGYSVDAETGIKKGRFAASPSSASNLLWDVVGAARTKKLSSARKYKSFSNLLKQDSIPYPRERKKLPAIPSEDYQQEKRTPTPRKIASKIPRLDTLPIKKGKKANALLKAWQPL